jgi:hypothetical protein
MRKTSQFWEFANAYYKTHVQFWMISSIASSAFLLIINPLMTPILMLVVFTFYILHNMRIGWTDDKIRNLILYKQLTKQTFTILEQQAIDQYFGKYQRKELILEDDRKRYYARLVWIADFLCVVLIGVSMYLGWANGMWEV